MENEKKFKDEEKVVKLLNLKEYKCGGWNPNTIYDMVKLFYLTDEFDISDETKYKLETDVNALNKFLQAFSDVSRVLDAICISISDGQFDEFKRICKQLNLGNKEIEELVNKLSGLYHKEVEELESYNQREEVRRNADQENASYNVCGSSHPFRVKLNAIRENIAQTVENLKQYIIDQEEISSFLNKDLKDYSIEDVQELLRRGELDLVIEICEYHGNEGEWGGLANEAINRKNGTGYEQ